MAGFFDYLYGPGGPLDMTGKPQGLPWVQPGTPYAPPPAPAPASTPTPLPRPQPGATYPSMAATAGVPYMTPEQVAGSVGGNLGANPFGLAPYAEGGPLSTTPFVSPNTDFGSAPEIATNRTSLQDGGGGGAGTANKLLDALRGVKAPPAPQAQAVRTPPPPQLAPIKGGEFFGMLASLGIGPQEFLRLRSGGR